MGARDAGRRVLVGLTVLTLLAGCISSASPTPAAAGAAASASPPLVYDLQANPQADIDAAIAAAKADGRRVLIDFGADWCEDCTALAADFASPQIKPFLDANFHVVRVYIGHWDANQAVQDKYAAGKFMPMIAVLDGTSATFYRGNDLGSAASMSIADVLAYLQKWAPSPASTPSTEPDQRPLVDRVPREIEGCPDAGTGCGCWSASRSSVCWLDAAPARHRPRLPRRRRHGHRRRRRPRGSPTSVGRLPATSRPGWMTRVGRPGLSANTSAARTTPTIRG